MHLRQYLRIRDAFVGIRQDQPMARGFCPTFVIGVDRDPVCEAGAFDVTVNLLTACGVVPPSRTDDSLA